MKTLITSLFLALLTFSGNASAAQRFLVVYSHEGEQLSTLIAFNTGNPKLDREFCQATRGQYKGYITTTCVHSEAITDGVKLFVSGQPSLTFYTQTVEKGMKSPERRAGYDYAACEEYAKDFQAEGLTTRCIGF